MTFTEVFSKNFRISVSKHSLPTKNVAGTEKYF